MYHYVHYLASFCILADKGLVKHGEFWSVIVDVHDFDKHGDSGHLTGIIYNRAQMEKQ